MAPSPDLNRVKREVGGLGIEVRFRVLLTGLSTPRCKWDDVIYLHALNTNNAFRISVVVEAALRTLRVQRAKQLSRICGLQTRHVPRLNGAGTPGTCLAR